MIIYEKKFRELGSLFSTNDGSLGTKGFVTDVLMKKIKPGAVIFACGPEAMVKGIKDAVKKSKVKDVKIFASLEAYMGCGIGACISCVCAVGKKDDFVYKRVCKEGTAFDINTVVL
jgi:dihydroorotate dehydrogenase electron transfer subunit